MVDEEIQEINAKLARAFSNRAFIPFIDFIQFPRYRRLASDLRIEFRFPLTVLVGQNGTGKTSVLHALFGAPKDKSVGKYWFSTAVDPIDEDDPENDTRPKKKKLTGERSAYWYGYRDNSGKTLQVLKTRIRRENQADYWEPSRPVLKYGMELLDNKSRSPAIDMESVYISARFHLTAFDRCFHFPSESILGGFRRQWARQGRSGRPQIQDYLRHKSIRLRRAIAAGEATRCGTSVMSEKPLVLSPRILSKVSEILGKQYASGTIVRHRYYETWGKSVILTSDDLTYSEAFAGSGESMVVHLVQAVMDAKEHSLLLIDEPETSLHPGAQLNLLKFLLEQALVKKLQVVLSTHSPTIVDTLPARAIAILSPSTFGRSEISQNVPAKTAFHFIGHRVPEDIWVIVEDALACEVLTACLTTLGDPMRKRFTIEYRPGGKSVMSQDIVSYMSTTHTKPILIFDGDAKPQRTIDPMSLTQHEREPEALDKLIFEMVGRKVGFPSDSNAPTDRLVSQREEYLLYWRERVFFLPGPTPEEIIWSDEAYRFLLQAKGLSAVDAENAVAQAISVPFKDRYARLADSIGMDVKSLHQVFVKRFATSGSEPFLEVVALLQAIAGGQDA